MISNVGDVDIPGSCLDANAFFLLPEMLLTAKMLIASMNTFFLITTYHHISFLRRVFFCIPDHDYDKIGSYPMIGVKDYRRKTYR